MYIEQLYTNCLSHAAYYIESNKEAVIIDPLADIQSYVDLAKARGAKIKFILETHFHADFVSGHRELAEQTGSKIVFGSHAKPGYDVLYAEDGSFLHIGDIKIKVLHTPGHTLESVTYLLIDEHNKDHAIFTGDTLFLGDVGRPDLSSGNLSSEELASYLYNSLLTKIMPLADDVIVYPGHGAGSACGKKLADATSSTLGEQKQSNYALRAPDKETFIKEVTEGMKQPPAYFFKVAKLNQEGPSSLSVNVPMLDLQAFDQALQDHEAIILDSRSKEEFIQGFIPGSINIGLKGRFAPWVGALLTPGAPITLIANEHDIEETIIRLARVGYTNIIGVFTQAIEQWKSEGRTLETIANTITPDHNHKIIDVRGEEEFKAQHGKDVINIPIELILEQANDLKDQPLTMTCASGYRAVMAASLLKQQGAKEVNVAFE